jgi:IS605 OrfB family transposase
MIIIRSSKHSIKFTTKHKLNLFDEFLKEYKKVVNLFIDIFWNNPPDSKSVIDKSIIDLVKLDTYLTYRARKVASYEAYGMVKSELEKEKDEYIKPTHNGKRIHAYEDIAKIEFSKKSKHFDAWIHIHSIGNKLSFDIPIKFHRHYHRLKAKGRLMSSCIISRNYIQFSFEIKTLPKKEPNKIIGLDTGINNLLVSSDGIFYGKDFKKRIFNIIRKKKGSKNQKSARRAIRHYIDETVKEIMNSDIDLIVFEKLKNITKGNKKKKSKYLNKLINNWQVSYLHNRLKQKCEENRIAYRTVSPYNTSRTCLCGYVNSKNRNGEEFKCLKCGLEGHSDHIASINILNRYFLEGEFPKPKV